MLHEQNSSTPPSIDVKINVAVSCWGKDLTFDLSEHGLIFRRLLTEIGWHLVSIKDADVDIFLSLEFSQRTLSIVRGKVEKEKRILVQFEPPAVSPGSYTRSTRNKFGKIVVVSPEFLVGPTDEFWRQGFITDFEKFEPSKAHSVIPGSVGVLNENKFSLVYRSLYTLRKRALQTLIENNISLRIGGKNWDKGFIWTAAKQIHAILICLSSGRLPRLGLLRNSFKPIDRSIFVGTVENGLEFLSQHEYALVIENDERYVSEKIFNALEAGAIPVYVGGALHHWGEINETAILARPNPQAILRAITSVTEAQKIQLRNAARKYLIDQETRKFIQRDEGLKRLGEILRSYLRTL